MYGKNVKYLTPQNITAGNQSECKENDYFIQVSPKQTLCKVLNIYVTTFNVTLKLLAEFPATFAKVITFGVDFISYLGS